MEVETMEQSMFFLSLLYGVVAMFLLVPPQEARSAGLTLENIFWKQLGSQSLGFVEFQLRRTTMNRLVASLLPFGYFALLSVYHPNVNKSFFHYYGLRASLAVAVAGIALAVYYWKSNWSSHPLAVMLGKHGDGWRNVAGTINMEFRRIDKFMSGGGNGRVIATESWLVKVGVFSVHVSKLSDTCLTLITSAEVAHAQGDVMRSVQQIAIRVTSTNKAVKDFMIYIPGLEYKDFRSQLPFVPVVNVHGVNIQQTLHERFLSAFLEQVNRNETYRLPPNTELDCCLGCMVATPDTKLFKQCAGAEDGECRNCQCRPQWCLSCMARWFASRQDQRQPETWMSSSAPCPNCRSRFCMLDVSRVVNS